MKWNKKGTIFALFVSSVTVCCRRHFQRFSFISLVFQFYLTWERKTIYKNENKTNWKRKRNISCVRWAIFFMFCCWLLYLLLLLCILICGAYTLTHVDNNKTISEIINNFPLVWRHFGENKFDYRMSSVRKKNREKQYNIKKAHTRTHCLWEWNVWESHPLDYCDTFTSFCFCNFFAYIYGTQKKNRNDCSSCRFTGKYI